MNLLIQNCSREKILRTTESATNSWEFWCFCKRFSNFYLTWIQIYRETEMQEGYFSIPHHMINTFQKQICCLNSTTFSNFFLKKKRNGRYWIHFLAQQKEPSNKQNSLTHYYSTYLRFLKRFLTTTTTIQGVAFHQCINKQPEK